MRDRYLWKSILGELSNGIARGKGSFNGSPTIIPTNLPQVLCKSDDALTLAPELGWCLKHMLQKNLFKML